MEGILDLESIADRHLAGLEHTLRYRNRFGERTIVKVISRLANERAKYVSTDHVTEDGAQWTHLGETHLSTRRFAKKAAMVMLEIPPVGDVEIKYEVKPAAPGSDVISGSCSITLE